MRLQRKQAQICGSQVICECRPSEYVDCVPRNCMRVAQVASEQAAVYAMCEAKQGSRASVRTWLTDIILA